MSADHLFDPAATASRCGLVEPFRRLLDRALAEAEEVARTTYGSGEGLDDILDALRDLAQTGDLPVCRMRLRIIDPNGADALGLPTLDIRKRWERLARAERRQA